MTEVIELQKKRATRDRVNGIMEMSAGILSGTNTLAAPRDDKMNKHNAWSIGEDAQLIHLCKNKMMGLRRYEAFNCQYPDRTLESVRQRIVTLRRKHKVR